MLEYKFAAAPDDVQYEEDDWKSPPAPEEGVIAAAPCTTAEKFNLVGPG